MIYVRQVANKRLIGMVKPQAFPISLGFNSRHDRLKTINSPHVKEFKTVLEFGFHAIDSGF